jgi:hypothetical protein
VRLIEYYASWYENTSVAVQLEDGQALLLHRLGLGRRYHFDHVIDKIDQADLEGRADLLLLSLVTSGIEPEVVEGLSLVDLLTVVLEIKELNQRRGRPPWELSIKGGPLKRDPLLDYEGRQLARVVHILASHYGWSAKEILELPPEIALAHVQECMLLDHSHREWDWFRSEVSWSYDKHTGRSRHRKMQPLSWASVSPMEAVQPVPEHIREKYWPKGVIVDLTEPRTRSNQSDTTNNEASGEGATATTVT